VSVWKKCDGRIGLFCWGHGKSEWRVVLYIIICNRICRQLCWDIDSVKIEFAFLYAFFYDCHRHLGSSQGSEFPDYWNSHSCVRKKGSEWRLFVRYVYKLFMYRVSHELRSLLRESLPYVKLYRYNPKHLYPKLNGLGDNGKRKVWTS